MQGKSTVVVLGSVAVIALGLLGWQSWNTHQLQQQVQSLQQQVSAQQLAPPLAQNPLSAPNALAAPSTPTPSTPPASQINPQLLSPGPGQTPSSPLNPPLANGGDPFWGGQDPFEEMQRMQQQMHQHMQDLMNSFGMSGPGGASLFDMDPFQGGPGFGSSMGFGADEVVIYDEQGKRIRSMGLKEFLPEGWVRA